MPAISNAFSPWKRWPATEYLSVHVGPLLERAPVKRDRDMPAIASKYVPTSTTTWKSRSGTGL